MPLTLVTGGAGYIGAHVVSRLLIEGHQVRVLDDLSTGKLERIIDLPIEFLNGRIQDREMVIQALKNVDYVVHLAASKSVEESMLLPTKYLHNNFLGTMDLLGVVLHSNVRKFVFSSSAAVYQPILQGCLSEKSSTQPPSPYGNSKLKCEELMKLISSVSSISFTCLRFFNVIGSERPEFGDSSSFNLVPKTLFRISQGLSPVINGTNFDTPDGTCIRDYVDVRDVAEAHVRSLRESEKEWAFEVFNLGSGHGYSVLEVLNSIGKKLNKNLVPESQEKRPGDPPYLVADFRKIQTMLGWKTNFDLDSMIESSIRAWEMNNGPIK